jgi:hypothetical protein
MRLEEAISIFSEQGVCELTRLKKGQLYKKIEILQQDRTKDPRDLYLHFVILLNGYNGVLLSESSKSYLHDTVYCDEDVKSNFDQTFIEQLTSRHSTSTLSVIQ